MISILITRPRYEITTHYLYYWSALIIKLAKDSGNKIFDLEKNKATRKNVESYLSKRTPEVAIFNGHGNQCSITG